MHLVSILMLSSELRKYIIYLPSIFKLFATAEIYLISRLMWKWGKKSVGKSIEIEASAPLKWKVFTHIKTLLHTWRCTFCPLTFYHEEKLMLKVWKSLMFNVQWRSCLYIAWNSMLFDIHLKLIKFNKSLSFIVQLCEFISKIKTLSRFSEILNIRIYFCSTNYLNICISYSFYSLKNMKKWLLVYWRMNLNLNLNRDH